MMQNLSPRERTLVGLLLPVILVASSFQFIWLPLQAKRNSLTADILGYAQVIDRVASLGSDTVTVLPATTGPASPLSTRVTQSAQTAGLILRRLEPEGDLLRVTVDDVAFANVVLWLSDLEVSHSVVVAAIEIDRRPAPGVVSARLLLKGSP